MKNQHIWNAISGKANEIGWPNDSTHLDIDRQIVSGEILNRQLPITFLWILHQHGTSFAFSKAEANLRKESLRQQKCYWFYWDGQQLVKCKNTDDAISKMN